MPFQFNTTTQSLVAFSKIYSVVKHLDQSLLISFLFIFFLQELTTGQELGVAIFSNSVCAYVNVCMHVCMS